MGADGMLAPGLSALIAGSSHLVMPPLKILASVGPSSFSELTPLTL